MSITTGGNLFVSNIANVADLNVTGPAVFTSDIAVTANVYTGNILTDGYFYANGAPFVSSSYGNAEVEALLASGTITTAVSTTGNVIAGNVIAELSTSTIDGFGSITFADGTTQTTAYVTNPQYGYFAQMSLLGESAAGEAIAIDDGGNTYVSYSYYDNFVGRSVGGIAKFNGTGTKLWSKDIQSQTGNPDYSQILSLEHVVIDTTPTLVAIGYYYDNNINADSGFMWMIDPDTGAVGSEFDTEVVGDGYGIRLSDAVFGKDGEGIPFAVMVGESNNEILQKTFTPLAPSTTDKLYVSWAEFNASGLANNEQISINSPSYAGVSVNAAYGTASPTGTGEGINLTVSAVEGGSYVITRVNGWSGVISGWTSPTTVRILGSYLGGVDVTNDFVFDFDPVIFNNNSQNIYAATSNLSGTPVSNVFCSGFNSFDWGTLIGTPTVFDYSVNTQAYIARLGATSWSKSLGIGNTERFYSVAVDDNGNSYVCGYYPDNISRSGIVAKYDVDGNNQWSVYVDSSSNLGITVFSIDLLAAGNVITVGDNGLVTKLDSTDGSIIWQVVITDNVSWDSDFKGTATPDGDYIFTNYEDDNYNLYVMRVSGTDGSVQWTKEISCYFNGTNGDVTTESDFRAQYIDCNTSRVSIGASTYLNTASPQSTGLTINFPSDGTNTNGTYEQFIISEYSFNWNTESTTSISATLSELTTSTSVGQASPTATTVDLDINLIRIGGEAPVTPPNLIENGTSWANIADADGNLVVSIANDSMSWTFATDLLYGKTDQDFSIAAVDQYDDGYSVRQRVVDTSFNDYASTELNSDNFTIRLNTQNTEGRWSFSTDNLQTPDAGGSIYGYDSNVALKSMNAGSNPTASLQSISYINDPNVFTSIDATTTGANIRVYPTGSQSSSVLQWAFDNSGNLTLPGNTFAVNYANGTPVSVGGNYGNANVFDYLGSNSNVVITTTGNVTAEAFVTGNLTIQSNVITSAGDVITIDPYGNGAQGNVVIQGNLDVRGTTTTINSNVVSINDLVFNVANNAANTSEANGGGIAVGPVDAEYATLLYSSTSNTWNSSIGLTVNGNATANFFIGDGSQLTNLPTTTIVAAANSVYVATNGDDTTGTGSVVNPFRTITKAITVAGNFAEVTLAPGDYLENVVIANVTSLTLNATGQGTTDIYGNMTISGSTTGLDIMGVGIHGTLTHSTSGSTYFTQVSLGTTTNPATINKSGSGTVEFNFCDSQSGSGVSSINITGAGPVTFNNSKFWNLTVANANATVSAFNSQSANATLTSGSLAIFQSLAFSFTNGGNAITATGGVLNMKNTGVLNPNLTVGRVNVGASAVFAYDDINFDRANSSVGISANVLADFQSIRVANTVAVTGNISSSANISGNYFIGNGSQLTGITSSLSGNLAGNIDANTYYINNLPSLTTSTVTANSYAFTYSNSVAYGANVVTLNGNTLYRSNSTIAANIPFAVGNTANTWSVVKQWTSPGRAFWVDPQNGLDTNDGTISSPFQTVARGQAALGSYGALYLLPGNYTETVTWTKTNINIVGAGLGDTTNLLGDWTFNHVGTSVRCFGIAFQTVTIANTGSVYFDSCNFDVALNITSAGYFEATNCLLSIAPITFNPGNTTAHTSVISNSFINDMVISGNTILSIYNCQANNSNIVLSQGTLLVYNSTLISEAVGNTVLTTSPGTFAFINGTTFADTDATSAKISIGGFYSLNGVNYDIGNSVVTGINIGDYATFDRIRTINDIIATGNVTGGNINTAGQVVATGNVSGGNIRTTNSVTGSRFVTTANTVYVGSNIGTLGTNGIAIGARAANASQGANAISIGFNSGANTQGANAVAIGTFAGNNTQGTQAIAIGEWAGLTNQAASSIAMGPYAGQTTQGTLSIAIGFYAGGNLQGTNSVAIGRAAGGESQGANAVSIGWQSGATSQGANSVAIGFAAGGSLQGNTAIAIGANAGNLNQGANSIAIGSRAGFFNQAANSIIINATGANLSGQNSGFYVAPVRNDTGNVTNVIYYNTSTNEITYGPGNSYGNANVATFLASYGSNTISTTGNVSVGNLNVSGTASNIIRKASGQVAQGVDVTLDNFNARVSSTGNVQLQISTVSGNAVVYGTTTWATGGNVLTVNPGALTVGTTPVGPSANTNLLGAGDTQSFVFQNTSGSASYRATIIVGVGYATNTVCLERLY